MNAEQIFAELVMIRRALQTLLQRTAHMATQADIDNAFAGVVTAFNNGIDQIEATVAADTAALAAEIAALPGVPQEAVDKLNAFAQQVADKMAKVQTDVAAIVPPAPVIPPAPAPGTPPPPTGPITVTPADVTGAAGTQQQLLVTDAAGNAVHPDGLGFASDTPGVAAVNAAGTVNLVATGNATITVTVLDGSGSPVTVPASVA